MEFEKTLFRVHEKLLATPNGRPSTQEVLKPCIIANFILAFVFFFVFLLADIQYRDELGPIGNEFINYKTKCLNGTEFPGDIIYNFVVCDKDKNQAIEQNKEYHQKNNIDQCGRKIADQEVISNDGENQKNIEQNDDNLEQSENPDNSENQQQDDQHNFIRFLEFREDIDGEFLMDIKPQNQDGEQNKIVDQKDTKQNNQQKNQQKYQQTQKRKPFDISRFCLPEQQKIFLQMSSHPSLINFPRDYRDNYDFNYATQVIYPEDYSSYYIGQIFVEKVLQYENIMINDIIEGFSNQEIHIKNVNTTESWYFQKGKGNQGDTNKLIRLFILFFDFMKIMFGLFLTSAITAIYIKITIICAPIFILVIIQCINSMGQNEISRGTLYRAFPWIGIYLYTLDMAQSKIKHLIKSFLMLILLFYCVYLSSSILISQISFFSKSMPKGLDENFFGFQAFIEFGVLLFLRTRSSIKWFPKTTILLTTSYLIYVQQTAYGFYYLGLYTLLFSSFGYLGLILYYFEIPSMSWGSQYSYTPTQDRPRTLYFPLFSMNWMYDLPQLWTMFYPLHGRTFFTPAQLSLVDRNYVLLHQTLEQHQPNINIQQEQQQLLPQQLQQPQQVQVVEPIEQNNNNNNNIQNQEIEMNDLHADDHHIQENDNSDNQLQQN